MGVGQTSEGGVTEVKAVKVYVDSEGLRKEIFLAGHKLCTLARAVHCGESTISNCLTEGKINPALLERICAECGCDPAEFRGDPVPRKAYKPRKRGPKQDLELKSDLPPLPPLSPEAVENLIAAIVYQAKKDYIRLYKMAIRQKPVSRWQIRSSGNTSLDRIEAELMHPNSYFRNVIIGNIADPDTAVKILISQWRKEAQEGWK